MSKKIGNYIKIKMFIDIVTAEIVILNREAVAIAADSAITFGDRKTVKSANKLYSLSTYQPVGIMIYGNAQFMGIPWEIIIKLFRKKINDKQYDTLIEYATEFINFIKTEKLLQINETFQSDTFNSIIYGYFEQFVSYFDNLTDECFDDETADFDNIKYDELVRSYIENICNYLDSIVKTNTLEDVTVDIILDKYKDIIDSAIKYNFNSYDLNDNSISNLKRIAANFFLKFFDGNYSGIVIVGFGENEIFPSVESYEIGQILCDRLKYRRNDEKSVKIDQYNNCEIVAFAQQEMIDTFIAGIDPIYYGIIEEFLKSEFVKNASLIANEFDDGIKEEVYDKIKFVNEKTLESLISHLKEKTKNDNMIPIYNIVSMLPKSELAEMAESLVDLTSLKRKASMDIESVSGPIDVALISKGDKFIWVKRKHYFEGKLNPHFFTRYQDNNYNGVD